MTARDGMQGAVALYGVAPVHAALQLQRRKIHALYLQVRHSTAQHSPPPLIQHNGSLTRPAGGTQESMNLARRKDAAAVTRIRAAAEERGVPLMYLSKHAMNALADNRPHQGVILDCGGLEPVAMDELPTAAEVAEAAPGAPPPVWLVLDEVSDPVRCLPRSSLAG